jgi:hypothetical protein
LKQKLQQQQQQQQQQQGQQQQGQKQQLQLQQQPQQDEKQQQQHDKKQEQQVQKKKLQLQQQQQQQQQQGQKKKLRVEQWLQQQQLGQWRQGKLVVSAGPGAWLYTGAKPIKSDRALGLIWSLLVLDLGKDQQQQPQMLVFNDQQQQQEEQCREGSVRHALLSALLPHLASLDVSRLRRRPGLLQQLLEVRLLLRYSYPKSHSVRRGFEWIWRALCAAAESPVPRRVTNECLVTGGMMRQEWVKGVERGWGVLMPLLQGVGRREGFRVSGLWWLANGEMYCLVQQQQKEQQQQQQQPEEQGLKGGFSGGGGEAGGQVVGESSSSSRVIAVVLNGPQHVDGYSKQLLGAAWVRDSILANKGYTVVALPLALWLKGSVKLPGQHQKGLEKGAAVSKGDRGLISMQGVALQKIFATAAMQG